MLSHPVHSVALTILGLTTAKALVAVGCLGVVFHRLYFIRGEHHLNGPLYLQIWLLVTVLLTSAIYFANSYELEYYDGGTGSQVFLTSVLLNCSFFGFLFGSMAVYRLLEHPLRGFHGPQLAALSKLWHFWHMFITSNHIFLDDLYRKYGGIIRTGPQELTVVDPAVWQAVSGMGTTCIKSPWYDQLWPYVCLMSLRTKYGYAPRRKRWDEALGLSATDLSNKACQIHHFASLLLRHIQASDGNPINVTLWFHNFAFDVIGDLAFGHSFSLIDDFASINRHHYTPTLLSQGISMLGYFTPAPWTTRLCAVMAPYVPLISQKWNRILDWAADICDARLAKAVSDKESQAGAFSRFTVSAHRDNDRDSLDRLALYGDALLMTVAGSHTTTTTLTMLFYELSRRKELQEQVRKEIAAAGVMIANESGTGLNSEVDVTALERLPFLNACIDEALRLYPPVPTGGIRQTVQKGIRVGDAWIPPQTMTVAPRWSIGRLETALTEPNEFVPERWTTKRNMVKDARAFNAFGTGRHICPGKQLGLMEVRMVTVMIISNFEVAISPTEKRKSRVVDEFRDGFTGTPGTLELVFTPLSRFA
ncbi:cytochrome P450 [Whalleya microplaca]|nr:cytochrome P450 [Whalleya microplaca]